MTDHLLAKPVLKNKFWIVEDQGSNKIATIQAVDDGTYVFVEPKKERKRYPSIRLLSKAHNISFDRTKKVRSTLPSPEYEIYGLPVSQKAYNIYWDVQHKFPVFTKNKKSKSYYCAGYYIVKFNNGWVKSYCPKLITLNRYEFQGPYKTKFEMQEQLRLANQQESTNG